MSTQFNKTRHYYLTALLITLSSFINNAHAQNNEPLPTAIAQQIEKQYAITDVRDWETGELDDSGNTYYAVLSAKKTNDEDIDVTLFLFNVQANGTIEKIVQSGEWSCSYYKQFCDVSIKKNSIFINEAGTGGACSHSTSAHQFKKRDNNFELIGTEIIESSCDGDVFYTTAQSINYLNNKMLVWHESGTEKEIGNDAIFRFKRTHTEKTLSINSPKRLTLEEFGDAWNSENDTILCNHFEYIENGKFNLVQCAK
jgi:hypothetical protein